MSAPQPRWAKYDKSKNLAGTASRIFRYLGRHRYRVYAGIAIAMIASFAVLIAPQYLKSVTDLISEGIGPGNVMDMGAILSDVLVLAALYSAVAVLKSASSILIPSASEHNGNIMRKDLNSKISRIPLGHLDRLRTGDVMSRFTNDADNVRHHSADSMANMIVAVTMIVGSSAMMVYTEWRLAIVAVIPALCGFFIVMLIVRRSKKYFVRQASDLGKINTLIEETYYGMDVVDAYNGKGKVREEFVRINDDLYSSALKARFLSSTMPQIMSFISNLGYVVVCVAGSMMVLNGTIGYGVIVAFIVYVKEFGDPMERLSNSISSLQSIAASAERVFEFLDAPEMEDESHKPQSCPDVVGRVEFHDVRFSYEPGHEVIHGFSLEVEPGQKIAIVGPTGSGKTTISSLLLRFYELDSGDISVDG
jgi:ATP-binding cassette subfamily B protein